jgi:predicted CopG family antitoxin
MREPLKAMRTSHVKLKHITVCEENYLNLKMRGKAGDSFNDVVTELLKTGGQKDVA